MRRYPLDLQLYAIPGQYRLEKYSDEWWEGFFRRIRAELGVENVEVFDYQVERDGLYNEFTPFVKEGSDWNLGKHDPESVSYTHLTLPTTPYV